MAKVEKHPMAAADDIKASDLKVENVESTDSGGGLSVTFMFRTTGETYTANIGGMMNKTYAEGIVEATGDAIAHFQKEYGS